jgi:hypothetical protein
LWPGIAALPHVRRFTISSRKIDSQYDDGNKEPSQYQKDTGGIQVRHSLVEKANTQARQPCGDQKGNKHVPWFGFEAWVCNAIHLDDCVGCHVVSVDVEGSRRFNLQNMKLIEAAPKTQASQFQ